MTKKTFKTEKVLSAFRVLNTAKYTKMSDEDKIKVWKISRILKPIADKFDDDSKDAAEKMKPEGFDNMVEMFNETQDRLRAGQKDNLPMTPEEAANFVYKTLNPYNRLITDATKEAGDKEVELEFEKLSEDSFSKLMASNEWTMEQVTTLGDIVCE